MGWKNEVMGVKEGTLDVEGYVDHDHLYVSRVCVVDVDVTSKKEKERERMKREWRIISSLSHMSKRAQSICSLLFLNSYLITPLSPQNSSPDSNKRPYHS
jgi:hypothetical protein